MNTDKTKNSNKLRKGFTLVELLVVISVIGVLSTLVLVSFGPVQKQARDTQRKSDIKQYQSSLESYANKTDGIYVISETATDPSGFCDELTGTETCPQDPKEGEDGYGYNMITDSAGSAYVLWALLENTEGYWVACSTGKVGVDDLEPSSSTCPL